MRSINPQVAVYKKSYSLIKFFYDMKKLMELISFNSEPELFMTIQKSCGQTKF